MIARPVRAAEEREIRNNRTLYRPYQHAPKTFLERYEVPDYESYILKRKTSNT